MDGKDLNDIVWRYKELHWHFLKLRDQNGSWDKVKGLKRVFFLIISYLLVAIKNQLSICYNISIFFYIYNLLKRIKVKIFMKYEKFINYKLYAYVWILYLVRVLLPVRDTTFKKNQGIS